jgi:WD40 repeat protein
VAQQQEYIGPMTAEELRRAIEEPARRGHWEFEPGLVDLILRDVGDEPGALPLLSHALLETWKRRAGHTLTLKGYADAGGVHGAIAHTAESIYQNLSPEEQALARDIFLRLTELGEGTEDTRRRVSFEELTSSSEDTEHVRAVLNKLAEARLITLGENTVEVAHEALIREWPTLREWLNQDREGLRLHRHLTEAAYEWELLGRDPGALYRGAHLAQARAWAELHLNALNAGERVFLSVSIDQEQREEQEREEQRQRELEAAQKLAETERARAEEQAHSANRLRTRNRVITTVGSIALILALLAGLFGVQSNRNAVQAESNFNRAEAQRLALEANRLLSSGGSSEQVALLSLRSMNIHYSPESDAALAAAARLEYPVQSFTYTNIVWDLAFSQDGRYVLAGDDANTAKLWDVQSGQELLELSGHTDAVTEVHISPNGKHLLTASLDGSIRMWDAATSEEIYRIEADPIIRWLAYSHDGKTLFTISEDNKIREWDAESGKEIRIFMTPSDEVERIYLSPDDKYLLTFSNTATLWDINTDQKIGVFPFDAGFPVADATFSADGNFLLTGSRDGNAYLWDVKTGSEVQKFIGHSGPVFTAKFSPDTKYVLTGGGDRTMRVWDIETGQELGRFTFVALVIDIEVSADGKWVLTNSRDDRAQIWSLNASPRLPLFDHEAVVTAAKYSPSGQFILTAGGGGEGGAARLWDVRTGEKLRDFIGHTLDINYGADFSHDGKYIVTGSWDTTIRLWDVQTGKELRQFIGDTNFINGVEFSPDDKYIVSAGRDGVALWDARTGKEIRRFGELIGVYRATFSPDGKTILTSASTTDGKARLWDIATGQLRREYQSELGEMSSIDFSPDGKYILADGGSNIVHVWETQTGEELTQLIGHTDVIFTAVFSTDGKTIATASADGSARLWDVQTGQEIRRFIGHTAEVESVSFSPDGKFLLTGSADGTARLWDVDYHTTMEYLCSRLLRDFTEEERAQYGITDAAPTCPGK